ncbi:MAG: hypothetical protein ACREDE_02255 [Thermoplasmata archaeon]
MRTGLLAAGAAVAIIGAGVLLASLTFSSGPTTTEMDPVSLPTIAGHSYFEQQLQGVNRSSADVSLVWSASQYLIVAVYPAVSCPHVLGVCPSGTALATWWGDRGDWSTSGSVSFPLFLNLSNPNATPTAFAATFEESYITSSLANPTWNLFLPLIGAVVLIAIGGVAVFLGLFLPQGVYSSIRGPLVGDEEDDDLDDDLDDDGDLDEAMDDPGPPPDGHS